MKSDYSVLMATIATSEAIKLVAADVKKKIIIEGENLNKLIKAKEIDPIKLNEFNQYVKNIEFKFHAVKIFCKESDPVFDGYKIKIIVNNLVNIIDCLGENCIVLKDGICLDHLGRDITSKIGRY